MVDRRHVPAAVTLFSVGFNTVRTVGPAIGGVVVASFGPSDDFRRNYTYLFGPFGHHMALQVEGSLLTSPT
jgi:hypothetical protein